jgi:hypothetical protein
MTEKADITTFLQEKAPGGTISCLGALLAAHELDRPPREIGEALDTLKIKIVGCQLGCFGTSKKGDHDKA